MTDLNALATDGDGIGIAVNRPYRVSRDNDGWLVRGSDGRAYYDEDWRWNSRATARAVAWELNGCSARAHAMKAQGEGEGS